MSVEWRGFRLDIKGIEVRLLITELIYLSSKACRPPLGFIQPSFQLVLATPYPETKRLGRETNHKFCRVWRISPAVTPYCLMVFKRVTLLLLYPLILQSWVVTICTTFTITTFAFCPHKHS